MEHVLAAKSSSRSLTQHQHPRGRLTPRLQVRAHAHAQNDYARKNPHIRQGKGHNLEGEEHARRARGRDWVKLATTVQRADEDKARQPLVGPIIEQTVNVKLKLEDQGSPNPPRRPPAPDARPAARKARELTRRKARSTACPSGQARRLLHRAAARPSCTWSRATRPAAPRSTRGTARSRRSCRCAAR